MPTCSARIGVLCSLLSPVKTFADVGCDHGYCTEYMLQNGLCERATVTDISADCLAKARALLQKYIDRGVCMPLCTDGLRGVDPEPALVLIAGMGGMEIAHILTGEGGFVPKKFVLQPMRDAPALRQLLLSYGARIERDFTFRDGKFYDVIAGSRTGGTPPYSEAELVFGRENLRKRGEDFLSFLRAEIKKKEALLSRPLQERVRAGIEAEKRYLEEALSGEID